MPWLTSDFSLQNLFDKVGRFDRVATFVFKKSSEAHNIYGDMVTGVIQYSKKDRDELEESIGRCEKKLGRIRLNFWGLGKDLNLNYS